jgi:hypothetical protein
MKNYHLKSVLHLLFESVGPIEYFLCPYESILHIRFKFVLNLFIAFIFSGRNECSKCREPVYHVMITFTYRTLQ